MEQLGQYYAQQGDGLDQGQQVEGSYDQSQGIGMLPPPSSMYYDEYEQNIAPEGSQNAPYYDEKLASTAFLPEGATVESLTQGMPLTVRFFPIISVQSHYFSSIF